MLRIIRLMLPWLVVVAPVAAVAQGGPPPVVAATAPAEPSAMPLYGDKTPGTATTEVWATQLGAHVVRNVTRPTLTPFLPRRGAANGAAVIVLPGGGFMSLSVGHEGWVAAKALAARGFTAFVLKYRLKPTPIDASESAAYVSETMRAAFGSPAGPESLFNPDAQRDAEAALRLVRSQSAKYGIDPKRVGLLGFSAGARTSLRVVLTSPVDARPDFFGYIYGDLSSRPVPTGAPPMFAAIAFDDQLYPKGVLALAQDWHNAKRPVELHVYQKGGHGFGLGRTGETTNLMLGQFVAWLDMQGFLKAKR